MSAVKGVNATLISNGGLSNSMVEGQNDARVKSIVDSYEAAALESGSVITVGSLLPAGARIKEIRLHTDNLQNNTTLSVGDSNSAARYISATDHGAAELVSRIDKIAGRDYVIGTNTGDNQILITTGAGEATGTIKIEIEYTKD